MKHIILTSMPDGELADRWNEFAAGAPFATHYVTPNYFTDPYIRGSRFAVLAEDDDREIAAVLTGVVDGERVISGMFSRPQMVFRRGIDRSQAVAALVEGITQISEPAKLVEMYSWEPMPEIADHSMQMRPSNETTSVVMLDLADGADAIFAKFSQTRRNEIRKAVKQGLVEVKELETDQELAEIYRIHCDWNERKGNSPDSFEQMRTAVSQTENRRVFIAKANGKVVAGSFYRFCPNGVVEYAANFSMPEYQKLRPNDLIGWHAIKWACEGGFSHFSMGGSHLFLRRFGGEVLQTYRYRRDRSLFKMHDLRENAREVGAQAYRRLPANVRNGIRNILAR